MDFVHLHVHSHFSPDGVASIKDLVRYAERQGMRALALTDVNTLAGVGIFCKTCKEYGIRPVIGCDFTMAPIVQAGPPVETPHRMVILAETEAGYRNLVTLVNAAHANQRRGLPRLDLEAIRKNSAGLIALTGSSETEFYHLLHNNRLAETETYLTKLAHVFGKENLIFQLEDIGAPRQRQINDKIFELSNFLGITCVATNCVSYLRPEDKMAHDFLTGGRFPSFLQFQSAKESNHTRHLASGMQMRDRFLKFARALYATEDIAYRCSYQPNYDKRRFPVHDFGRGIDADSFLWDLTFREARAMFVELSPEIKTRLNEEFDYIKTNGLANNILLLWNIAQFARKNRINVGVGRGDIITSLIAYILDITRINPLDYKMRFLGFNKDSQGELSLSVEMPSAHIDALHEFMRESFGADFCSAVGKYTLYPKSVLSKSILSWLYAKPGRPEGAPDLAEKNEFNVDTPIEDFFPGKADGVALPAVEAEAFLLSRLLPRPMELVLDENQFAISAENLNNVTPRVPAIDQVVTQMDGSSLDLFHIPRMTIQTDPILNILNSATYWIRKEENNNFDADRLPMDDSDTYDLLSKGLTNGIEPFSAITLKSLLRAHRPRNFMSLLKVKGMEKSPNSESEGDIREHVPECLLTYRCAYTKAHYPMSFMAAMLTFTFQNRRKFTVILREAKQMGLKILPPDINLSVYEFSQVHKAIRTGLLVISGMDQRAFAELNRVRRSGDFNDIMDIARRTDPKLITTRLLENMVKAGALDSFGLKRSQMLRMIAEDAELSRRDAGGTLGLFEESVDPATLPPIELPHIDELPLQEIIRNEIAATGYCISFDQLHLYKDLVEKCRALSPADLTSKMVGKEIHVAGFLDHIETDSPLVEDKEQILLDLEGHVVTMPLKVSRLYDQALHASAPVLIGGTVHKRKDEVYVKALSAFTLRMVQQMSQNVIKIKIDLTGEDSRTLRLISNLISYYKGEGTQIEILNFTPNFLSSFFLRNIEKTPVFFSPPFYYALKKILPEEHIEIIASEDMDPALLHALSPLRFPKAEPKEPPPAPDDNTAIVDSY